MDVQIATVSASPTATSATNATATASGKTASKGSASKDTFSTLLAGQTGKESAAPTEGEPSDAELSMNMMLQMLQSLIMPIQATVDQGEATNSEKEALPELLLEAMNSNPALADKLLQDPKVKKWFENAEDMLAALGSVTISAGTAFVSPWQQPIGNVQNLKVQSTLLSLAALSKQQPDNPILKYLNDDLAKTIEPLLPEVLAGLVNAPKVSGGAETNNLVDSTETEPVGAKKQATTVSNIAKHKYISKRDMEQAVESTQSVSLQSLQTKPEKFAIKHIPASILELSSDVEEQKLPLVDLPVESNTSTNTIVTIADLQKSQALTMSVEKAPAAVITAANFTEEMTAHVLKNMKITMSEGFSEAKLSLFPKNLGHVDVKISMHDGQLFAQFAADSLAGKQMLESQLPQLRQALLTQGLQVEKLEVTQSQNMSSSMFQEQRQPQTFNQSQRQPKNRSNEIEVDALDFKDDMEQVAQLRNKSNGNSFDVTA